MSFTDHPWPRSSTGPRPKVILGVRTSGPLRRRNAAQPVLQGGLADTKEGPESAGRRAAPRPFNRRASSIPGSPGARTHVRQTRCAVRQILVTDIGESPSRHQRAPCQSTIGVSYGNVGVAKTNQAPKRCHVYCPARAARRDPAGGAETPHNWQAADGHLDRSLAIRGNPVRRHDRRSAGHVGVGSQLG